MSQELLTEPQFLEVEGSQMAYHRQGSGETVILVHGITTYSFIWRNIAAALANDYDVIAIDLLGCGESEKNLEASYALKAHARRLSEFVKTLGIERFHLVGHDLGGGIAQIYATKHPETLIGLALMNSVAFDFWPVQPITALRTPIVRQLLMATLDFGTFRMIVRRGLYYKERVTPELMEYYWMPIKNPEGRKAFLHFAKSLDNHDLMEISDRLETLDLPVLILRGDADAYLDASSTERLHAVLPDSRLHRIAEGGHYIQEDQPEWIVEHLEAFFGECRGRAH